MGRNGETQNNDAGTFHAAALSAIYRLWPSATPGHLLRRELASVLLEDPDCRLRVTHAELLLQNRLAGNLDTFKLQAAVTDPDATPYFCVDWVENTDWSWNVVRLNLAELLRETPYANGWSGYEGTGYSEHDIMSALAITWQNYQLDDDEYLAVVVAWIVVTKRDSKGVLAPYSLHMTEVGGYLRAFSAADARLAGIFPRNGKKATKQRPRLSEFLVQPKFKTYFHLRESTVRKSEKVVALLVEQLMGNLRNKQDNTSGDGVISHLPASLGFGDEDESCSIALPQFLYDFEDIQDGIEDAYDEDADLTCSTSDPEAVPVEIMGSSPGWPHQLMGLRGTAAQRPLWGSPQPPAIAAVGPMIAPPAAGRVAAAKRPLNDAHGLRPARPVAGLSSSWSFHPGTPLHESASPLGSSLKFEEYFSQRESLFSTPLQPASAPKVPKEIACCWEKTREDAYTPSWEESQSPQDSSTSCATTFADILSINNSRPMSISDDTIAQDGLQRVKSAALAVTPKEGHLAVPPPPPPPPASTYMPANPPYRPITFQIQDAEKGSVAPAIKEVQQADAVSGDGSSALTGAELQEAAAVLLRCEDGGTQGAPEPPPSTARPVLSGWAAVAARDMRPSAGVAVNAPLQLPAATTPATKAPPAKDTGNVSPRLRNGVAVSPGAAAVLAAAKPETAKLLAKLSPRLKETVVQMVQNVPGLKLEDFDDGVVYQLNMKREDDAIGAVKAIADHDLNNIQHMAAFVNFIVKNYHPGENGVLTNAYGGIGAPRAMCAPVSSKAMLQKLPPKVYKRLADVVNGCSYLEWKHFDAGVIKVLSQLSRLAEMDVFEELDLWEATDLSNVEYMPAYLNKRLNNRLWSRKKGDQ